MIPKQTGLNEIETITMQDLESSLESLTIIAKSTINPAASFYFAKLNKVLKPHMLKYKEFINSLFDKYADLTDPAKPEIKTKENMDKFDADKKSYLEITKINIPMSKIRYQHLEGLVQSCYTNLLWCIC